MPISVVCPNGHKLKAKEQLAGKQLRCPKCGADVFVQAAESAAVDESAARDASDPMPSTAADATDVASPPRVETPDDAGLPPLDGLPSLDELPALDGDLPLVDLAAAGDNSPLGELGSFGDLSGEELLADAGAAPLGTAQPLRSVATQPARPATSKSLSFPPLVWAAAAGGVLVGFVLVVGLGWLLFGGGKAKPDVLAAKSPPTAENAGPTAVPPDAVSKPAETAQPTANPAATAAAAAPAAEPAPPASSGTPPTPADQPPAAPPAPGPWDLVRIGGDQRMGAFQLPSFTWSAAYDAPTGRLAITQDAKGVLIYSVDDVLAGKLSPSVTIATDGVPTAVCLKVLADRRVWAIAGQNAPTIHVLDAESLKETGAVTLDKAKYVDFLTGSANPANPFLYYSTQGAENTGDGLKPNRFGRINLVTMQPDGQTVDAYPEIFDAAIPDQGDLIYCGLDQGGVQLVRWPEQRDPDGGVNLQVVAGTATQGRGYVPAPDGQFVAVGYALQSPRFWETNGLADFMPQAFFRSRPLMFGVSDADFVVGSSNDCRRLDTVTLHPDWRRADGRLAPRDFRMRPQTSLPLYTSFLAGFADDQRQVAILVLNQGLAVAELAKMKLPAEKSLLVANHPPETLAVGQEVTVELATEAEDVAFEWVGVRDDRSPPQSMLLEAPPANPVQGKRLTLAAAVNSQQAEILLADLTPLAGLAPPLTLQLDDEQMTITAIDDFRTSLRVQRAAGSPHSVTAPALVLTGDASAAPKPSLPTVDGRTFRWTPSRDQIGRKSIRLSAKSGQTVHRWHWDVDIEQPTAQMPFYLLGIKPEPGGKRAVVWGQPAADVGLADSRTAPTGKFFLGVLDLATKQMLHQREVPRRITAATLHETDVYAGLDMLDPAKATQITPSRILRFRAEDLEVTGQVATPEHCNELEVIAGRYLAGFSRWGETYRFTVPDLKPVEPELPENRELRPAGRLRDGWLWDGVVWDQALQTPRLLLFPFQYGAKPSQNGARVLAGALGQIRLHSCGPYVCTWYQDEQLFHPGFSLVEYPGTALCEYGKLNLYSWEDGGKFTGDRDRVPDGQIALLAATTLNSNQVQAKGYIADEAGVVYVVFLGQLHTVPLDQLVPKKKDLFRLDEQQSTFVLAADKPTKVQYSAPGAVRYDLQLYTMLPGMFDERPAIEARSTDGSFELALEVTAQTLTNVSSGMAGVAGPTADSLDARLTAYGKAVVPAFRALTGRAPRGVPFPVYAVVVAENAEGKKAGLAHSYLLEVPLARLRQILGGGRN